MKISIIHPSRGRPQMFWNTQLRWVNRADNKDFEYILSLDSSDIELAHYTANALSGTKFCVNGNRSAIEAINNAAKIATGDLLIVVSDDFDCPEHWDSLLLFAGIGNMSDFIVKTQDGIQPTLITLPIMDRKYYERFGYIYHPDYLHMFSDQEMTAVGHMLGRVLPIGMEFKHNHYSVGGMVKDAINAKNDSTWSQGQNLFNERLKSNFGIADGDIVKPYSEIVWR